MTSCCLGQVAPVKLIFCRMSEKVTFVSENPTVPTAVFRGPVRVPGLRTRRLDANKQSDVRHWCSPDLRYHRASGLAVVCSLTSQRKALSICSPGYCRRGGRSGAGRSSEKHPLGGPPGRVPFKGCICDSHEVRQLHRDQGATVICFPEYSTTLSASSAGSTPTPWFSRTKTTRKVRFSGMPGN